MTGAPEERKPKDPAMWIGATSDRVASLLGWIKGSRPSADRMRDALAFMLVVPFVLLFAVAGLCVAGTTPGSFGIF